MTSAHVALQFSNCWLSRYPRPVKVIYDQGKEFVEYHFSTLLENHGIKGVPITVKNPQSNAIVERMHQAAGNVLRTLLTLDPPVGIASANNLVETALANVLYATRATIHSALNTTPGALVFGRDMILNIPLVADLHAIQQRRQQIVDQRLLEANKHRFNYDYQVGDEVYKLSYKPNKLGQRAKGPYRIISVHTNGTVTIRLNQHTIERINIRRIRPCKRDSTN